MIKKAFYLRFEWKEINSFRGPSLSCHLDVFPIKVEFVLYFEEYIWKKRFTSFKVFRWSTSKEGEKKKNTQFLKTDRNLAENVFGSFEN